MQDPRAVLRFLGWYPGRAVENELAKWEKTLCQEGDFEMFPSARKALLEFGGLNFRPYGMPGIDHMPSRFDLDPLLCQCEEDRFEHFAKEELGMRLFPMGESSSAGYYFIAIAEDQRVFELEQEIYFCGWSMEDAIFNYVRGKRPSKRRP